MDKKPKVVVNIDEQLMSVEEVAEFLKLKTRAVEDKLRSGELTGYKKFGRWYCLKSDIIQDIKK